MTIGKSLVVTLENNTCYISVLNNYSVIQTCQHDLETLHAMETLHALGTLHGWGTCRDDPPRR